MSRTLYPSRGGGSVSYPISLAQGGTGQTSRVAALMDLYGFTPPPQTGWTAWNTPAVNGVASDNHCYKIGKALSAVDEIHGVYRSVAAGAFRCEAWICTDVPVQYMTHGLAVQDNTSKIAILGRTYNASEVQAYSVKATSDTLTGASRSAITWATYGGSGPSIGWNLGTSSWWGFAIERASGGGVTFQFRPFGAPEWTTYGTTANDGAALGLASITRIGFFGGHYDFQNLARGRIAQTYLGSWSVT